MFNKTFREKYIKIDQPKFVHPQSNFLDPALQAKTVQSSVNYFVDLATAFANWTGAKVSTENLKIQADEVAAFESKLVNMSSSDDDRRNYSLFNHNRMTISEFQNLTDTTVFTSRHYNLNWNWTSLIQNVLKSSNITITPDEVVEAHEIRNTLGVLKIVASTDPRIVANYCIWRLATALIRYTTTKIRELVKMHEKYDTSNSNMYESQNCQRIAMYNSVLRLPLSIKYMKTYFSEEMKIGASKMADNIKATFLKQIESSSSVEDSNWLDARSKLKVEKKIKNVESVIGYPDWYIDKDQTFVESQFAQLNIQEGQYFQSLLKLSSFQMTQKY